MLYSGRQTVTTAGTLYPLTATKTMASWITVVGDISNTGTVYIGGYNIQNASGGAKTYIGHPLVIPAGGGQPNFLNIREIGGPAIYDLSRIFVTADNNGDAITFNYGRR